MKYIFEVNMMVPVRFEVAANTPREAMKKLFEMNNYNCWEYTDSYNCGEWLKDTDICDELSHFSMKTTICGIMIAEM